MTTRVGNAGDFQALAPMMRQYRLRQQQLDPRLYELRPHAEALFRRWIGQMADDPRSMLLVAEEEGRIVGFLYSTMEKDAPIYLHDEYALVREWWVEPASRGRGVGRALIDRAAAELAGFGVRQLRVRAAAADADAAAMLEHCGFHSAVSEMVREVEVAAKGRNSKNKRTTKSQSGKVNQ
jgi:GNAT superfamily N-acetyltransferase